MRTTVVAGGLALLVLLTGCQSMSESQCRVADWGRVGFNDALQGVSESRLANYAEDCGKIGVQPDKRAYRSGWDAGIVKFCMPVNGWRQGVEGHSGKESLCTGQPGYAQFSSNLYAGLQVYNTTEQIRRNDYEIHRLQDKLEKAKDDGERKNIRRDLANLDHDQYRLRQQLSRQQLLAPQ
jgi:hypothetical protein